MRGPVALPGSEATYARRDRVGTWETSGRPQPPERSRAGSGRRGAEAGREGEESDGS